MRTPRLCYVEHNWAYFTTQKLDKQWGDDWNDVPYEHNAGRPYTPCWHNEPDQVKKRGELCDCKACQRDWNEDGTPKWEVIKVAFDGAFLLPHEPHPNSPYSVERINESKVAWLRPDPHSGHDVHIFAGTTLDDFIELVHKAGGEVYVPERRR